MDFLSNLYSKAVSENERNLLFWEDYLKSLNELNFHTYSENLTIPVLVPIGSRILFRGALKHTNEVIASIGADYFAKCSIAQAEILRQHRIKDAQAKVDMYRKGKEYLENQLSFRKENIYDNHGQEIVEEFTEEEDKAWRVQHRENVKRHKMNSKKEAEIKEDITDEELWNRLEELELQEELENELAAESIQDSSENGRPPDAIALNEEDVTVPTIHKYLTPTQEEKDKKEETINNKGDLPRKAIDTIKLPQMSKLDLLQQVINRQNELGERLQEMKDKERNRSKSEKDLMSRLDEMEQIDELEDEMNRLDDIIEGEDVDSDEDDDKSIKSTVPVVKRSVFFADEDDSETIVITFKHSEVPPSTESYDPSKGIQKPSDIYSAYSNLFSETTSILKKSKYTLPTNINTKKQDTPKVTFMQTDEDEFDDIVNRTIIVKDIVEKNDRNGNMVDNIETRPTSLFKKKRMQKKT